MERFQFKLEPVRALREQAEQQAQHALAEELAIERDLAGRVAGIEQRLTAALAAAPSGAGLPVDPCALQQHQRYVERVERERREARSGLATQADHVQVAGRRLEHAAREREVLERLRERDRERHVRRVAAAEEATLGEIAIAAHVRRTAEAA